MNMRPGLNAETPRILVTNDDGIHAPGLKVLTRIANTLSNDVWIVAPEVEQSGAGHSLSLNNPLRVRKISSRKFAVSGTPTDCVLLGVKELVSKKKPVQLVLSGVNRGCNVAEDITYSGTIAGAMEGTLLGIPSIAISQEVGAKMLWATAEHFVLDVLQKVKAFDWPPGVFLSVNVPNRSIDQVKGVVLAVQGRRKFEGTPDRRLDPKGRAYYWIGGTGFNERVDHPESDHAMLHDGYVTATPLMLELTHRPSMAALDLLFNREQVKKTRPAF